MSMPTSRFVRYTAGAAILTIALAGTAACSSSASSSPSASSSAGVVINGHNAQDMAFLTDMIAHHQQAIDIAQMVPSHTNNAKVTALAATAQSLGWTTERPDYLACDRATGFGRLGDVDVKIDGSFVMEMEQNPRAELVCQLISAAGRAMEPK